MASMYYALTTPRLVSCHPHRRTANSTFVMVRSVSMDESEQKAISDLLRTVRIGLVIMAIIAGVAGNEMMGVV